MKCHASENEGMWALSNPNAIEPVQIAVLWRRLGLDPELVEIASVIAALNFRVCAMHTVYNPALPLVDEVLVEGHAFSFSFICLQQRSSFLKTDFIYSFLERGKGRRKRGRETSICGCLSHAPLLGTWLATQACALDWESNWRPFGL